MNGESDSDSRFEGVWDPILWKFTPGVEFEVRIPAVPVGEMVFDYGGGSWYVSAHGMGRDEPYRWPLRNHHVGPTPIETLADLMTHAPRPGEAHLFADSCHLKREGDWVWFRVPGHEKAWCQLLTVAIALGVLRREVVRIEAENEARLGEVWDGDGPWLDGFGPPKW